MAVIVLGWPGSALGPSLARELGAPHTTLAVHRFPDGESLVRIDAPVEGEDVVFAVSLDAPDTKALPLLFAADAARELGARRVALAAPYLAYMRQDKRFHPGEAITSRSFASLLSGRFDALVTVDPHLHRWHRLQEIYHVPTVIAQAAPAIAAWIAANVDQPLIVGPDAESGQWVAEVARLAHAPHAVMEKARAGDRDVTVHVRGELPRGCTPVLVDDIVSTGRTIAAAARALRDHGMPQAVAVGVHALMNEEAEGVMHESGIARIVTCDTVEHATNAITVVPALARSVRRLIAQ